MKKLLNEWRMYLKEDDEVVAPEEAAAKASQSVDQDVEDAAVSIARILADGGEQNDEGARQTTIAAWILGYTTKNVQYRTKEFQDHLKSRLLTKVLYNIRHPAQPVPEVAPVAPEAPAVETPVP